MFRWASLMQLRVSLQKAEQVNAEPCQILDRLVQFVNDKLNILIPILIAVIWGGGWYGVATLIAPAAVAQATAVTGGLILTAVVSVVMARRRVQIPEQALALAAIESEVWVIDRATGWISYRNTAAETRVKARRADDIVPPDQRYILRNLLRQAVVPGCCTLRIGEKTYRPSVVCVGGLRQLMLVLCDITQEIAEQQVKNDFISTVSHELRSPLTSIKGSMGLLLSNAAGQLPDPARELLEISHRNADRLVVILNDILDLQKIADDGLAFESVPIDASALIHEAIAASSIYLQRFDLKMDVIGTQNPVMLNSDPNRIMQVLGNLLTNAAKFSRLHSTITVIVEEKDKTISIHVQDQGEGIGADDQKKIFGRFADLANSDRQKKGGSGLGLSICKAIVDRLGGNIRFTSTLGVGTTFSVHLPKGDVMGGETQVVTQQYDAG